MFGLNSVLSKEEAKQLNPVVLAFVGDAVYSLYVREKLVFSGGGKAADFQRTASKVVSAHGQSELLEKLLPLFTEEEAEVFRRGRNAKKSDEEQKRLRRGIQPFHGFRGGSRVFVRRGRTRAHRRTAGNGYGGLL